MYKARFIGGLRAAEPITLHYVISMDNKNQTGEAFLAFVDLVNQQKAAAAWDIIRTLA